MKVIFLILVFTSFLASAQDDCIFNNNYKVLTKEWIDKSNTDYNFRWVEEANTYVAKISEHESIELSKGGCYHFGTSLVYRTSNKGLDDVEFWMSKALKLAKQYNLKLFIEPLNSKSYSEYARNERYVAYSFPLDEHDNSITEGIVIKKGDRSIALMLSYYIN